MRRATVADAELINDFLWRDSGKRPNFYPVIAEHLNVILIEGDGAVFFVWRGPGIYEVHLALSQRGAEAFRLIREMLQHMRDEYGARLFWAAIPIEARKVIMFARRLGWKPQGLADLAQGTCELFQSE